MKNPILGKCNFLKSNFEKIQNRTILFLKNPCLKHPILKSNVENLLFTNCCSFAQWFGLVSQRFLCQGTEPCHMQGPPIQNAVHVQRLFFYLATGGFLLSPTATCLACYAQCLACTHRAVQVRLNIASHSA
jgi:hypothetical protein